ncbi:MAG: oligopeptide transporter, OPT family [Candidatus Krumholzibacteriota bacterium]|nr:oligopeptide transporter, OPT family [Candidatus Krumholzibacteriota bacterium]
MEQHGIKGLPPNAYTPLEAGESYTPYVPAGASVPETTVRAVVTGLVMAVLFTAAAAYLGLKIGQVFEAAIPIAILAVGLSGVFRRRSTILENVIIQSIGSASGVVVAGMIFTLPAIFILDLELRFYQTFLAALLGGFLGILFIVPLRRFFVKEQHGLLPFPEGTAITEVIVTGEQGGDQAKVLVKAAVIGGLYDFAIATFGLWREVISTRILPPLAAVADRAKLVVKVNAGAAVMGLGYIIGIKYASIIAAGSFVSWLVLIPAVWFFGRHIGVPIGGAEIPIPDMTAEEIFTNYVRHIGIGGIAAAGIIGILKNSKIIVSSFSVGLKGMFAGRDAAEQATERTDTDMPMSSVVVLIFATLVAVFLFFGLGVVDTWTFALIALVVVAVISFLFTTVAARAIAIVGVNPVSGMTLMTLILSSVVLVKTGLHGPAGMVSALIIGGVVCTALSTAGAFISDLKVGYWIGSTPRRQESWKFLGILVAAASVTGVILLLNRVYGFSGPDALAAPQANAMAAVIRTLMSDAAAPWGLYIAGIFMALILEFIHIPPLAFALGMYLPIELNTPILVGGIVSWLVMRSSADGDVQRMRKARGTLIASGFIAGGALMGVVSALIALPGWDDVLHTGFGETAAGEIVSLVLFVALCAYVYIDAKRGARDSSA